MATIQYRIADNQDVRVLGLRADGSPVDPFPPLAGYGIATVDSVPPPPGVLQYVPASNTLMRYVAPPTPQQTFDAAVAAGYTVPDVTPPFVLPMDDASRNLLHQLSYQLFTMQNAGQGSSSDPFPIADIHGTVRTFSAADIQTMVMGLGRAYLALWSALRLSTTTPTTS